MTLENKTSGVYAPPKTNLEMGLSAEEQTRRVKEEERRFDQGSNYIGSIIFGTLGLGTLGGAVSNYIHNEGPVGTPLGIALICAIFAYGLGKEAAQRLRQNQLEDIADETCEEDNK